MNAAHTLDTAEFAEAWAAAWNRRDVEAVLTHFHEQVVFRSPIAASITGNAELRGKEPLRAYWIAALQRIGELHFTIVRVYEASGELVIVYSARLGSVTKRAAERMVLNEAGLVIEAEALYGAELASSTADENAPGRAQG